MKAGSILRLPRSNLLWQIESIELGGIGETGVIRMVSLSVKNTIDGEYVEAVVPVAMVDELIMAGRIEVYNKFDRSQGEGA